MSSNAINSLKYACKKWKIDYIEELDIVHYHLHPCFSKISILEKYIDNYERILYIDGDILIRSDTPNPFDLYDTTKFLGIKDLSNRYTKEEIENIKSEVMYKYYPYLNNTIGGVSLEDYTSNFFNGGFFIFNTSRVKKMFEIFKNNTPTRDMMNWEMPNFRLGVSHHEQALLNYCVRKTISGDVKFLSDDWNCVNPPVELGRMENYVYHFTGFKSVILKEMIKNYHWIV